MKILYADDDKFMRAFISSKLKTLGHEVDLAEDGQEALTKIESGKPDALLLDLVMPKMDGFAVLKEIKSGQYKDLPVVVVSSLEQEEDIKKVKELGAYAQYDKSSGDISKLSAILQKISSK